MAKDTSHSDHFLQVSCIKQIHFGRGLRRLYGKQKPINASKYSHQVTRRKKTASNYIPVHSQTKEMLAFLETVGGWPKTNDRGPGAMKTT